MKYARWLSVMCVIFIIGRHGVVHGDTHGVPQSPAQQLAVNAAIEGLIQQQDWQGAQNVVQRYLGSPFHNAAFFEKAIIIYFHQGAFDKARLLAAQAEALYPDYAPFIGFHALLLARDGHCQRARSLWSDYVRISYFPLKEAEQAQFDHYCDFTIHYEAGMTSHGVREERVPTSFGGDEITARQGSQLEQLCSLLTGLCPADRTFTIASPPPPRNALVLQYHSASHRRHNWRHATATGIEVIHHIGGYRKKQAHLYASWSYRFSPYRYMSGTIGAHHSLVPAAGAYPSYSTKAPYLQWHSYEQLSKTVSHDFTWRHSAQDAITENRHQTSHHDSVRSGLYWQMTAQQKIGAIAIADLITPPHNNEYGVQKRDGYGLEYHYQTSQKISARLTYERTQTRFEKTVPFLTMPHRIVEKRVLLRLSRPFEWDRDIIFFVTLGQVSRQSDNPRQQGRRRSATVALSFQF